MGKTKVFVHSYAMTVNASLIFDTKYFTKEIKIWKLILKISFFMHEYYEAKSMNKIMQINLKKQ